MKTLKLALKTRDSIFDEEKRDDTLDLSNLINESIDVDRFFSETFFTDFSAIFDAERERRRGRGQNKENDRPHDSRRI